MTLFHALLISVIEGITEFLPISSTGHMILAAHALQIPETEFLKSFELIIQLGAILAVVVLYAKRILTDKESWAKIGIAFLPSATAGFLLYKVFKQYLIGNPFIVVVSLCIGGIILILFEKFLKPGHKKVSELTTSQAFLIGVFQTISMIPGVSRSASTIIGGLVAGLSRNEAVEFSFLLAIPTMAAATGYDLIKSSGHFTAPELQLLGIGFVCAFITALVAVRSFITFVQKHSFNGFGIYRIVLAVFYWFFVIDR